MKNEQLVYITQIQDMEKGKKRITFDTGVFCMLYRSELRGLYIEEDAYLPQSQYEHILYEIVAKRAKKRVLYLLEKMDRTEHQIREKLKANEYPDCCVEIAIEYAKSFHYIDDYRYACTFVRGYMEKYSRMQLKQKLLSKGIIKEYIEQAIEEEYLSEETNQIQELLRKKKFGGQASNTPEFRKMYQFLLRRGFKSSDILNELKKFSTSDT